MIDQVVRRISRRMRSWIIYGYDFSAAAISLGLSYYLRTGTEPTFAPGEVVSLIGIFTLVCVLVFPIFRLHSGSWRYASVRDIYAISKAVTASIFIFLLVIFLIQRGGALPRSVLVIEWFVLTVMLGAPRMAYRLYRDSLIGRSSHDPRNPLEPVLLFGFNDEADVFIRAVKRDRKSRFLIVGIIETNPRHVGRQLHGVPVLSTIEGMARQVTQLRRTSTPPTQIIVARVNTPRDVLNELVDAASQVGLTVNRLPNIQDLQASQQNVEPEAVKIEDLLGRQPVVLDEEGINRLIAGRSVLITGAGGSVGSEIVKQVVRFGASRLILLENSEHNLYEIDRRIRKNPSIQAQVVPILCDIRDREALKALFMRERPELVFHAAALKHVPIVERNPVEAVLSNVFGTKNAADAACASGASAFIMISTDKAANAKNVLGLTKGLAERYCQKLDREQKGTRFMIVRFGNVLGSRGSVLPLFEEQLKNGGPLTVTHADVTRYFMTPSEAAQLVLQASAYGVAHPEGGGKIYLLDMGEPVRIADLARNLIRLAGRKPDVDVPVVFTGLRPGEKLHEDLVSENETVTHTPVAGVLLASAPAILPERLDVYLTDLHTAAMHGDNAACVGLLRSGITELCARPTNNVRSLMDRAPG
ncbi:polysaccharide biosynthesis protein [Afifella sp. YEN Y35]|uniref:polysaccharide biosynthesis protein n=1 Tax=Afifella sp. YEN Y35 TaxID=3388337 RepID=UPI0039E13126